MKEYDEETLKKIQKAELEILEDFIELCEKHNLDYFGFAGTGIGALRHQGFIPWDDDIDVGLPRKDYEHFLKVAKEELSEKYIVLNAEENENFPLMTTHLVRRGTKFIADSFKDIDCEFGIFLDIFPFDNISDDVDEGRYQMMKAWFFSKLLILRSVPNPVLGFAGIKGKIIKMGCKIIHIGMKIIGLSKKKLYQNCKEASCRYNHIETKRINFFSGTFPKTNIILRRDVFPLKEEKFENLTMKIPNKLDKILKRSYGDYMEMPPLDQRKNHYPYKLIFHDEAE